MTAAQRTTTVRSLDQDRVVPLFHQLAARLRDEIFHGVYRPHDQIPSEPELCRLYQVSRATVRMALDKLVEQRLIYRRHGKGTFVSPPQPQLALLTDPSFAREMALRGIELSYRTLGSGKRRMPPDVVQVISSTDECAYCIERVFMGDGEPWGIARIYFHPGLGLTARHLVSDKPVIDLLLDACGVRVVEASYLYLEPILLAGREASLVELSPGTPGLNIARLFIDQTGRAVAHIQTLIRGDRCRLLFSSRQASSSTHVATHVAMGDAAASK